MQLLLSTQMLTTWICELEIQCLLFILWTAFLMQECDMFIIVCSLKITRTHMAQELIIAETNSFLPSIPP